MGKPKEEIDEVVDSLLLDSLLSDEPEPPPTSKPNPAYAVAKPKREWDDPCHDLNPPFQPMNYFGGEAGWCKYDGSLVMLLPTYIPSWHPASIDGVLLTEKDGTPLLFQGERELIEYIYYSLRKLNG